MRQKTKSKTYGTNHTRSLKHNLNLGLEAGSSDSSLILVVPCQLSPMIKIPHPPLSHYLSINIKRKKILKEKKKKKKRKEKKEEEEAYSEASKQVFYTKVTPSNYSH